MTLPSHIPDFDLLNFVAKQAELVYIYGSMEIQLNEFKKNNPQKNTAEAEHKINLLKDHLEWIRRLEREYETVCRINIDYVRTNLILISENEGYKKRVEVLSKQLNAL